MHSGEQQRSLLQIRRTVFCAARHVALCTCGPSVDMFPGSAVDNIYSFRSPDKTATLLRRESTCTVRIRFWPARIVTANRWLCVKIASRSSCKSCSSEVGSESKTFSRHCKRLPRAPGSFSADSGFSARACTRRYDGSIEQAQDTNIICEKFMIA